MKLDRLGNVVVSAWAILAVTASAEIKKPNIIVVYTDDHGYADLSCQGVFDDVKTPHIDSLAAGGVRMTDGYSSAPQCVPSRAGLLSGQYQNKIKVEGNGAGLNGFDKALTIAERLKAAGYATGMSGKWHLGAPMKIPNHGFDWVYAKSSPNGNANHDLEGNEVAMGRVTEKGYHLEVCADAACAFIDKFQEQPFFYYLSFRAPHVTLDPTQKYLDRFPGEMPERRRKALAMISAVDDGVGNVMKTLRMHGLEENTLIFVIGDNGAPLKITKADKPGGGPGWDGSLNDPMNGEKGTLAEGGIRVPFVTYWKGKIPPGQTYEHPVIALDVAATAVELAGLPKAPELDGTNLIPYLTGQKKGAPHEWLFWRWGGQGAVRHGNWKLLRGNDRFYLFNLAEDVGEKKNLIKQHPEIAEKLGKTFAEWSGSMPEPNIGRMSRVGSNYFDFYLDGKKPNLEPTPKKGKAK
jgi:uncharacterized sulfatase